MTQLQYVPEGLDLLAAHICRQAYRDATRRFDETNNPIPPKVKVSAKRWWNKTGRYWAETLVKCESELIEFTISGEDEPQPSLLGEAV